MTKRPYDAPRPNPVWRIHLLCIAVSLLAVPLAHAQNEELVEPMGGDGGTPFLARCPQGELLTSMDLWAGADIDAIRPVCVSAVPGQVHPHPTFFGTANKSKLGIPLAVLQRVACPNERPIVIGMDVGSEGQKYLTVNNIHLYCGMAVTTPQRFPFPLAVFDAPRFERGVGQTVPMTDEQQQRCPPGLVAVGLVGRAGLYVDAVGLICGAALPPPPPEDPNAVRPAARVKLPGTSGATSLSICEAARLARARNSSATAGLEAQCRAQELLGLDAYAARGPAIAERDPLAVELRNLQPEGAGRRGFDIGMAVAEGQTAPGPGKQRIHDALQGAEQAGYDAAVSFSLARNRQRVIDFALKAPAIVIKDPLAVLLRSQQPNDSARRGFDIGMGAAEGQTGPGPGKQRIHDNLPAPEQSGFAAAVDFSLERNRNAALAAKGADLVRSNPRVAAVRNAEANAFYRLGFDIAIGFFSQSANGTGAMLKLRDTLSTAVRGGFDAAVELNTGRK